MAASMKTCWKTTSSNESDRSDNEDMVRLRETTGIYPSVTSSAPTISHTQEKKKREIPNKPSLRPAETDDDENKLQATAEVRAHIAKKLTEILDRAVSTKECSSSHLPVPQPSDEESAFRLFSTSIQGEIKVEPVTKRRRLPSSSSDSSDDGRFECCAVSGDFILEQSRVPTISTESTTASVESTKRQKTDADNGNNLMDEKIDELKPKKCKKRKKDIGEKCIKDIGACDDSVVNGDGTEHKKHKKKKKKRNKETS